MSATTDERIKMKLLKQINIVCKDIVARGGGGVRFSCTDALHKELLEQGYSETEVMQKLSTSNKRAIVVRKKEKTELLVNVISEAKKLTENGKGACVFAWKGFHGDSEPEY